MTTTQKVIGAVAVAAAAFGIYWFFIREGEVIAGAVAEDKKGGSGGGGGGAGSAGAAAPVVPSQTLGGTSLGLGIPNTIKPPKTVVFKTPIKSLVGGGRGGATIATVGGGRGDAIRTVGADGSNSWSSATGYI